MAHVVYVHGLWMPGEESLILRHRLAQDFGLTLHPFRYSAAWSIATIVAHLHAFVCEIGAGAADAAGTSGTAGTAGTLHFVGHSLGGLVIYRFLERHPDPPPGRVVFLGTPCVGSRAAERAGRFGPVAQLMGRSVAEELLHTHARHWGHARELGVIAGSQSIGVGHLIAGFDEPNDGTVAVSETRMPGAADHLVLPVSHMGMLVSARVARETGHFLAEGRFSLR